jgi:dihydroorotase
MIDPHTHLRDWNQAYKETVKHGLEVAYRASLDAVFEMPNTSPAITSRQTIEDRLKLADEAIAELKKEHKGFHIWHGLYAGVTADPEQIKEIVEVYNEHRKTDKRVVGLKMFAGQSTGNMGIIEEIDQIKVYETLAKLNYRGVLAVHCEKESLIKKKPDGSQDWDPSNPYTHASARPAVSELDSVRDQATFSSSAGFKGTLHVCHVSVPEAVRYIYQNRHGLNITCGATPHHCTLNAESMQGKEGLLKKMNPPLRSGSSPIVMRQEVMFGDVTWIESDHAYHTLDEKSGKAVDKKERPIFASGIPVFPFYPRFIKMLREKGISEARLDDITHNNILAVFGLTADLIPNTKRAGIQSEKELQALEKEYEFNAFAKSECVWV